MQKKPNLSVLLVTALCLISPYPASIFAETPPNATNEPSSPISELLLLQDVMIEVASQEAETLQEAPVITSVVTGEEIRRMGARTLNDVLLSIPGFSHVQDQNEYYSAERGIYASSQQKILVMRDGHRLNNRAYSEANFDYSISLDNVKRIEILRGPGGSLYGDVALTAVVNIVTKDGKDINGAQTTAGFGNYNQKRLALVAGKSLNTKEDLLLSGAYYQNEGQYANWTDPRYPSVTDSSILYGFRELPSYDLYMKYQLNDLRITGSRRYSNYIEPRSGGGTNGRIYDIYKFPRFNGEANGLSSTFDHWESQYVTQLDTLKVTSTLFFDANRMGINLTQNPTTLQHAAIDWKEWAGGLQIQATQPYSLAGLGKGSVLLGGKAETFEVYSSSMASGIYPNYTLMPVLKTGKEKNYAGFVQLKHSFDFNLIFNAGIRYDYKERRPDEVFAVDNFSEISPRVALIYLLNKNLSFRLNGAHSFVDAPYWYRYNSLPGYTGAVNLKPEKMNSYQFSIENNLFNNQWINRVNVFYNYFKDVVYRDAASVYSNAGKTNCSGTEFESSYKNESLSLRLNYTFQHTDESNGVLMQNGQLENVPQHLGNLIIDVAPLGLMGNTSSLSKKIWLNFWAHYVGSQFSRWGKVLANPANSVDSVMLYNAGLTLDELLPNIQIGFHAFNIGNQTYYQGGSVEYPYMQPWMWYMAEITYKF